MSLYGDDQEDIDIDLPIKIELHKIQCNNASFAYNDTTSFTKVSSPIKYVHSPVQRLSSSVIK